MTVNFGAILTCDTPGCSNFYNIPHEYYKGAIDFIKTIMTIMAAEGWDIVKDGLTYCPKCNDKRKDDDDE